MLGTIAILAVGWMLDVLEEAEARLREAEGLLRDLPDHSDLDAAQFKINMVVSEANAKIGALEAKLKKCEERGRKE